MTPDPYLAAIQAAPADASTTDGYSVLERSGGDWHFTERSDDAPGWALYVLDDVQAADVLRDFFPGSFGSPQA
jgi:hypothetical protein